MKKKMRIATLALAVALAGTMLFGGAQAVMADATVVMPASKTISLQEGVKTTINFGTTADYQSYYYYQIKPSKTGYIHLKDDFTHGYNVVLCNAKKKVISRDSVSVDDFYSAGSQYTYQDNLYYGVKKGKTYYLRIKGGSTKYVSGQPYLGTITYTTKAVKGIKAGKSKKKAVKIKKGKVKRGLFVAGTKKAQWYKITTTKKKIKIWATGKYSNGYFDVTVYYKSYGRTQQGHLYPGRYTTANTTKGTVTSNYSGKRTYYVKVTPKAKTKASGYYTLKWK